MRITLLETVVEDEEKGEDMAPVPILYSQSVVVPLPGVTSRRLRGSFVRALRSRKPGHDGRQSTRS